MDKKFTVSVLMPCYNSEKYLEEAVESILNQTFLDFEFIIVDDGSTDQTYKILSSFAKKDERIRLYKNEKNIGIVKTRNRLLSLSKGKYIALLDSDDIAMSERIEIQVDYMEKHPDIGLLGSWVSPVDENGVPAKRWKYPLNDLVIKTRLLFSNAFASSSVMIRREALPVNGYDEYYAQAEDYDLYCRISKNWKVFNLNKILIKYRIHSESISRSRNDQMERFACEAIKNHFSSFSANIKNFELHRKIGKFDNRLKRRELLPVIRHLYKCSRIIDKDRYFFRFGIFLYLLWVYKRLFSNMIISS